MKKWLLDILVCPSCEASLEIESKTVTEENIHEGTLSCSKCAKKWPIVHGIPRFVDSQEDYCGNFGWQWDQFRRTQIDGFSGFRHSRERFCSETGWQEKDLKGCLLLDGGCGAGRFSDIALSLGARVVAVDISSAVDACHSNLEELGYSTENYAVVQASLYYLPFRAKTFQKVYSIGVIQHTPDRVGAIQQLAERVVNGGEIALWIYEWKWQSMLNYRFFFRWLTRYLPNRWNWYITRLLIAIFFPIGWVLSHLPFLGFTLVKFLPIAFRRPERALYKIAKEWSILDTFDNLSPRYDVPMKEHQVRRILVESGMDLIERKNALGLAIKARKSRR